MLRRAREKASMTTSPFFAGAQTARTAPLGLRFASGRDGLRLARLMSPCRRDETVVPRWSWKCFIGGTPMLYVLHLADYDATSSWIKVGGHGFDRIPKRTFEQRYRGHLREFRRFHRGNLCYLFFVLLDARHVGAAEAALHAFCRARFRVHHGFQEVYLMRKEAFQTDSDLVRELHRLQQQFRGHAIDERQKWLHAEERIRVLEGIVAEYRRYHQSHSTVSTPTLT